MLKSKLVRYSLVGLVLSLFAGLAYGYMHWQRALEREVFVEPQYFEVQPGQSFNSIVQQLKQKQLISETWSLKLQAKLQPKYSQLQAGLYQFSGTLAPIDFIYMMRRGRIVEFKLTFTEGSEFKQWQKMLAEHPFIEQTNYANKLAALIKPHKSAEGLFFPDTYSFHARTTDFSILKQAFDKMQQTKKLLPSIDKHELSWYQILILASIVEKETAIVAEMPIIASVFLNRLKIKMRLQTDPTVIYGLGDEYKGDITRQHLKQYTPYNTYKISGLPPTPIAMPSKAAIEAVISPANTKYLYFVADGKGGHKFSTNLQQHNLAVRQYLKQRQK